MQAKEVKLDPKKNPKGFEDASNVQQFVEAAAKKIESIGSGSGNIEDAGDLNLDADPFAQYILAKG